MTSGPSKWPLGIRDVGSCEIGP